MTTVKKHDFVELEYTGRILETKEVFDTTNADVAKASVMFDPEGKYAPTVICVGKGHLLPGIDRQLEGKDVGQEYTFRLEPEDAFGKKDAKQLKLMASASFKKHKVVPQPGLQVSIDGKMGTIRSVAGGRVVVDFNHPLAGRQLEYQVKVLRLITDKAEQLTALTKLTLGREPAGVLVEGESAKLFFEVELPEHFAKELAKEFKDMTGLQVEMLKKPDEKAVEEGTA